jgi:hypothetical protein
MTPEDEQAFEAMKAKYEEMWNKADKVQVKKTLATLDENMDAITANLVNLALHAKTESTRFRAITYILERRIFAESSESTVQDQLSKFFNKVTPASPDG